MTHSKHVIVISYDAFGASDWAYAKKQPHLAKLLAQGSYSTKVKSVYPSLTYVIHSSYVTGNYPNKHGVYHNNPFQPFEPEADQRWHWYRSDIQTPTIYDAIHQQGMTVAGLLWPVSGKSSIKYNIPEIRAIKKENQALKILKSGSPLYSMMMDLKFGRMRQGIEQPYLDDFTTSCAVDTLKTKKPNLLLMHLIDLDDTKHAYGTTGPLIEQTIERMDRRLGQIIQATEDAGIADQTTFIVIGDHSQLDVQYKVHLNTLFKEHGLIYEENGQMHWHAYVQGAGGAAYLYTKDASAEKKALALLQQAISKDCYGIEAIYTREELNTLQVPSLFSYMLEGKVGYAFEDSHEREIVYDLPAHGKKYATHGYSPLKPGYTSNFVAAGRGIRSGIELDELSVIDLAPTLAQLLQIEFPTCDGRALTEILTND